MPLQNAGRGQQLQLALVSTTLSLPLPPPRDTYHEGDGRPHDAGRGQQLQLALVSVGLLLADEVDLHSPVLDKVWISVGWEGGCKAMKREGEGS